jgi:peptidoglycan/LPS O-acetylase OafA/YrhL
MNYRAEIDGLRAVAVLPVIAFHAGLGLFSGGFAGVDVFFVLSGYLITAILLDALAQDRYSLTDFYVRRARRLLPALGVVVLACVPFAWMWMGPAAFESFARSVMAVGLFASNILFWQEGGYFATAAEAKPLLHTWSLAVEEQYYLLFPPLLALMWRRARRHVFIIIAVLAVGSFMLAVITVGPRPEAAFYLAPTRAWELLAGSLAALVATRQPARPRDAPAALGLAMILATFLLYDADTPFPSAWTLLPVAGSVLVIRYAQAGTCTAALLSCRPLVGIGLISYSAYLWHQPLFAFARLRSLDAPAPWVMGLLAGAALGLAWLTWRYVEQPFRRPGSAPVLRVAGGVLAGFVALGLVLPQMDRGLPAGLGVAPQMARDDHACALHTRVTQAQITACLTLAGPRPKVVLIGDSHAMAVSAALRDALAREGRVLISFAHVGCYPIPGTTRLPEAAEAGCHALRAQAWETLAGLPGTPVMVFARWTLALRGTRFDNGEGGREHGDAVTTIVKGQGGLAGHTRAALGALAAQRPVVVLGPFPEAGWHVPERLTKMAMFGAAAMPTLSTAQTVQAQRDAPARRMMQDLLAHGVAVVPLAPLFCGTPITGRCVNAHRGTVFYTDDDHPSDHAAGIIARAAVSALKGQRDRRLAARP